MKRKRAVSIIAGVFLLFVFTRTSWANNMAVANVTLESPSTTNGTIVVEFDISWDNSWRNDINYDAAWVFVKYKTDADGAVWQHAQLYSSGTDPSGYSTGNTGYEMYVPLNASDSLGYGCFIYRKYNGSGAVDLDNVNIVWDWNASGLSATTVIDEVEVYAIEMVYIPQDDYYLGDGDNSTESTLAFHENGADNTAVLLNDLPELTCDSDADEDIDDTPIQLNGYGGGIDGNTSYPDGYGPFFVMKYEISQGQYTDFLNSLTRYQQNNRVNADVTGDTVLATWVMASTNLALANQRSTITCPGSGNGTTQPITFSVSRPYRACNYLTYQHLCAFADWAAMRPMSEMEFEKMCRGSESAVYYEFAWGNTDVSYALTISGTEDGTETITYPEDANCCSLQNTFSGGDADEGPLRAGIFATSISDRERSGASYYGVMELSGNCYEIIVNLGTTTGQTFTGLCGDGQVVYNESADEYEGNGDTEGWPGMNADPSYGVSDAVGVGLRGGGWNSSSAARLSVSDRNSAASTSVGTYNQQFGGRCVRNL